MSDLKHIPATKLLWIDLEMTGLDPRRDAIVEVAAKVTDFDFNILASYDSLVHQDKDFMFARMNEVPFFQANPQLRDELIQKAGEGKPSGVVEQELAVLIQTQFQGEPAVLAGNSIHQDRRFIRASWPRIEGLLHYRMLDISSWKIIMQSKYHVEFQKRETHRALDDIQESIEELQYYLDWFAKSGQTL